MLAVYFVEFMRKAAVTALVVITYIIKRSLLIIYVIKWEDKTSFLIIIIGVHQCKTYRDGRVSVTCDLAIFGINCNILCSYFLFNRSLNCKSVFCLVVSPDIPKLTTIRILVNNF